MQPKQELSGYMKAILEESAGNIGPHLSTAELIAYQQGTLEKLQYEQAQSHLLLCAQCIEAFKDVSDFFSPEQEEGPTVSEFEIRRQWHSFKQQFPMTNQSAHNLAVNKVKQRGLPMRLLLTAAGIVLALGGLGLWIGKYRTENQLLAEQIQLEKNNSRTTIEQLQSENRKLEEQLQTSQSKILEHQKQSEGEAKRPPAGSFQPLINTQSIELAPKAIYKSTEKSAGNKLSAQPSAQSFLLILKVDGLDGDGGYALEIFDQNDRPVGPKVTGLIPDRARFNRFTVTIPRSLLKKGEYRLQLLGQTPSGWRKVAEYDLAVTQ